MADKRYQYGYCNCLASRLDLDTGQVWYWQRPAKSSNDGDYWILHTEKMWTEFKHFPIAGLQDERKTFDHPMLY